MIKIECDPWEQKQLSEYLQYAKKKLIEDCNNGSITTLYLEIELNKINNLLNIIAGKGKNDYLLNSASYRRKCEYNNLSEADKEIRRIPEIL